MKTKVLYLIMIIGLFSFYQPAQSQVTIGSGIEPLVGSILDLKEDSDLDENSKKGLGLPRVRLNSPTDLTVDDNANRLKYKGLTVYNLSTNNGLAVGTYTWDGEKWMQVVVVDKYGTNGQILTSKGNGIFDWSTFTVPEYTFHRPTQIGTIKDGTVRQFTYRYNQIVYRTRNGGNPPTIYNKLEEFIPNPTTFDNHYVYEQPLYIKAASAKTKYMLLGTTISTRKQTIQEKVVNTGYWEKLIIEIFINDTRIKQYERVYSTSKGNSTMIYSDLFSVIPITGFTPGTYTLKIKVSVGEHILRANEGLPDPYGQPAGEPGDFYTPTTEFYYIYINDINFILYEED